MQRSLPHYDTIVSEMRCAAAGKTAPVSTVLILMNAGSDYANSVDVLTLKSPSELQPLKPHAHPL